MTADIRRAAARFRTGEAGRDTAHSFAWGPHYDPANLGFGPMVCHNDDHLAPGAGYPNHPHTNLEIVTWVLDGALVHTDSTGGRSTTAPGGVQVTSAGAGIVHSEVGDPGAGPTRFVQVWVRPDEAGTQPVLRDAPLGDALATGALVPVVSGRDPAALLPLGTRDATLHAGVLTPGQEIELPEDPLVHVFVARGGVRLEPGVEGEAGPAPVLGEADAVRLTDEPGRRLTATAATELLVWSFRHEVPLQPCR
ncbi:pirin family protein [Nocardioides pacificus]